MSACFGLKGYYRANSHWKNSAWDSIKLPVNQQRDLDRQIVTEYYAWARDTMQPDDFFANHEMRSLAMRHGQDELIFQSGDNITIRERFIREVRDTYDFSKLDSIGVAIATRIE